MQPFAKKTKEMKNHTAGQNSPAVFSIHLQARFDAEWLARYDSVGVENPNA